MKAARFPGGAWRPGDFLSIDNQPLQPWPILQLDDMSLILGLPRGFKHSEPPGVRRNVTSYQFGCCCADRAALPRAHCSAFCQDVPRELNPIVHGRENTIG